MGTKTSTHTTVAAPESPPADATHITPAAAAPASPVTAGTPVAEPTATTAAAAPAGSHLGPLDLLAVPACKTFRAGFVNLRAGIEGHLRTPPAGFDPHKGGVSKKRLGVMPMIVGLVQQYPEFSLGYSPDEITGRTAAADAMDLVAADLENLAAMARTTGRLYRTDAWTQAGGSYTAADHQSKGDPELDAWVAPIRAALKRGPLVEASAKAALKASQKADRVQARASKAHQQASAATRRHARAAQAITDNQAVASPSPVPLANPQGPAASADVNPQGPAVPAGGTPRDPTTGR